MLNKIIESFKAYCEKNERSYKQFEQNTNNCEQTIQYSITPLPDNLKHKLEEDVDGELYVLILLNDDITTMDYVIQMLKLCFDKRHYQAVALTFKVHNSGSAQIIPGNKMALEETAKHIEIDAREKKFPIKFIVKKSLTRNKALMA